MALLLRRGLEADRLSFIPLEGELIYVTDTKLIYVGDGITPGGILVAGGGSTSPTYLLGRSSSTVNEGDSFTITLTTTNISDGTLVPYTITGVSSADIDGANTQGNFTVNSNSASLIVNTSADTTTEGTETFTLTLDGIIPTKNISVSILDTSTNPSGGPINGGDPGTVVFDSIINGGDPGTVVFDEIIDGGTP